MPRAPFNPRVSIVTGGASGIGRAIAAELVARGSHVVVADLDGDRATRAATELTAAGPGVAEPATVDVSSFEQVRDLVDRTEADRGPVDVMVNNAGIALGGLLEELDERHWDRALAVNLGGVVNGVRAVYPHMSARRGGHILNTASLAGLIPAPAMLPYTTTKHAVVGLSTGLRAEAAALGIGVTVLCPGFVDTPLLDEVYEAPPSIAGGSVRQAVRLMQPKFLSAETVAARAVRGLERNQAVVPVGVLAHLLWRLNRWAPPAARGLCRVQARVHRSRVHA
ncbi:SDR family NAD(P)-dependent oxidoreductase [Oryzihumus leptocrescens]|uniref:Short-subunit dehydrogenase n=1 Tax=Oryzihumus leptocrescens TaxID=297536 RepID=A0A542ZNC1_9MICO|nr:SDR family NAD(P)-dependent oxidoreductase [Oryzihumus leptocrescens]TQL61769.1 short-subunit dehydrogenase [Oryzihumus leptocrescens]